MAMTMAMEPVSATAKAAVNWIPAFAGMAASLSRARTRWVWIPVHQGNDEEMERLSLEERSSFESKTP
ncbi:MAG: hypothetical protein LBI87_08350 [Candidatus Accumulibacter sp.]|nr:hypothetical protein [Accumulibacter sp.]